MAGGAEGTPCIARPADRTAPRLSAFRRDLAVADGYCHRLHLRVNGQPSKDVLDMGSESGRRHLESFRDLRHRNPVREQLKDLDLSGGEPVGALPFGGELVPPMPQHTEEARGLLWLDERCPRSRL